MVLFDASLRVCAFVQAKRADTAAVKLETRLPHMDVSIAPPQAGLEHVSVAHSCLLGKAGGAQSTPAATLKHRVLLALCICQA